MILAFCFASIVVDVCFHVEYEAYELNEVNQKTSFVHSTFKYIF